MNRFEFGLYIHEMKFKLDCHEKTGMSFQTFFESIMVKADPSFEPVKPNGSDGDWKCDGFSHSTGTVYQVYAPEDLTARKAAKKIEEDFVGAKGKWGTLMKRWVFVYSAEGQLPPQVVQVLGTLKTDNPGIIVDTWNREGLWEVTKILPETDRTFLFGPIPELSEAREVTAAEVQTLLNFLAEQELPMNTDSLVQTELAEKIRKNELGSSISTIVQTSLPIAKIVQDYTYRHPDPLYRSKIASALVRKYKELSLIYRAEPDKTYWGLISFVAQKLDGPQVFWSSAGIVTYYFQLCDVFEP